jgi:hypothetical protein
MCVKIAWFSMNANHGLAISIGASTVVGLVVMVLSSLLASEGSYIQSSYLELACLRKRNSNEASRPQSLLAMKKKTQRPGWWVHAKKVLA